MKGKINVYTCAFGHKTVTIDKDDGTTPMTIRCRQKAADGNHDCTEIASSAWYRCNQRLEPEYQWYKPGPEIKLNPQERDHVRSGGLLLRKIKRVFNPNKI